MSCELLLSCVLFRFIFSLLVSAVACYRSPIICPKCCFHFSVPESVNLPCSVEDFESMVCFPISSFFFVILSLIKSYFFNKFALEMLLKFLPKVVAVTKTANLLICV